MTVNKIMLIGNVGQDAELKTTNKLSTQYARFTLATNENYRNTAGEWVTETEWHTVKAWGLIANKAVDQCKKGTQVYVEGTLKSFEYEGRRLWEIKATRLYKLDKEKAKEQQSTVHPSNDFLPPEPAVQPEGNAWGYPIPNNNSWRSNK